MEKFQDERVPFSAVRFKHHKTIKHRLMKNENQRVKNSSETNGFKNRILVTRRKVPVDKKREKEKLKRFR